MLYEVITALTAAGLAQDPAPTPFDDETPVKVVTEEIKLNVSAFDRFGEFVSGVAEDDLVIMEDGRLHQPVSVRRIPANVLIMLDTGGEFRQVKNISRTRDIALQLVRELDPRNSIAVLEYSDKARVITSYSIHYTKLYDDGATWMVVHAPRSDQEGIVLLPELDRQRVERLAAPS